MKKFLLFFTLLAALISAVFAFSSCTTAAEPPDEPEDPQSTLTVTFVRENQTVHTEEVQYGEPVEKPENLPDGLFIVWLSNGAEYDFNLPVRNDLVLTAALTKTYTVSFIADGILQKTESYSYYAKDLDEPPIPPKTGYTAQWEEYALTGGDITVNAIYSPVIYFVRYFYDGTLVHECNCAYDDIYNNQPPVTDVRGCEAKWEYTFDGSDCTARLGYIPIIYTVNFVIDGNTVKTVTATVLDESSDYPLPEIPAREHYSAEWIKTMAEGKTVEYAPRYTPVTYKAEFRDGDNKIYEQTYDVENPRITKPPAPSREHYDCEWESYTLDGGDKIINLIVTPKVYTVSFYANGTLAHTVEYTIENTNITPPPVPEVAGMYGSWESFTVDGGDITVNAVYTEIEGTAGLLYKKNEEGYTLYGYSGTESKVTVPLSYNGQNITRISTDAFNPYSQNFSCDVEEVHIYAKVHTIEKNAFLSCTTLKKITFPDGLKEIGDSAFMSCTSLESVILPDSVENIGKSAFAACGIKTLKLPASLQEIISFVFQSCTSLTEIVIPDGVESIASYAFANCTSLERIIFGTGLKNIDVNAFYNVTTVTYAEFKDPSGWEFNSTATSEDLSEKFSSPETAAEVLMTYQPNDGVFYKKADG